MRTFQLVRSIDLSGVSGTGVVAEGVEFANGQVVLGWLKFPSVEVQPSLGQVQKIHGHGGSTVIQFTGSRVEQDI